MICGEKRAIFLTIFIYRSAKKPVEKRSEEDEQTLVESSKFSSSLFASKMSATYKPVTLNCSCWRHIINILLTELSRSVWENLDLGRVYRPHCVRSVLTTSVKILPYRPPARLIRAKYRIKLQNLELDGKHRDFQ